MIPNGVSADGRREVQGSEVGDSEDETFWTEFLRGLRERGPAGVRVVISGSHAALKRSISKVMSGGSWQHCWVH